MINLSVFVHKDKPENISEEQLRAKLLLLIQEMETLKEIAENKLRQLESCIEVKMSELENRLVFLEERLAVLNRVLSSLEPSKRVN